MDSYNLGENVWRNLRVMVVEVDKPMVAGVAARVVAYAAMALGLVPLE